MALNLCKSSDDSLYLSFMEISQRVSKFLSRHKFQTKNLYNVDEVNMLLVLCTPLDGSLYLYRDI